MTDITNSNNLYWRCFLALEKDFLNTLETVEFNQKNYQTFSIKYRSIILQAGSEIETQCKLICGIPLDEFANMEIYRNYLNEHHAGFQLNHVQIPLHNIILQPWLGLEADQAPSFWKNYQAVKHQGLLEKATLENALHSLAGLFLILMAQYCKSAGLNFAESEHIEEPKFFTIPHLKPSTLIAKTGNLKLFGFTESISEAV